MGSAVLFTLSVWPWEFPHTGTTCHRHTGQQSAVQSAAQFNFSAVPLWIHVTIFTITLVRGILVTAITILVSVREENDSGGFFLEVWFATSHIC